jgi:signal transduction histidine kinase
MVAAVREAVANAVRHAGGTVRVYVECHPAAVEVFVRDRGPGFEPEQVPKDRLGLRESVVGRMERHGGTATIRTAIGEGTEVRLCLPFEPAQGGGGRGTSTPGPRPEEDGSP